MSTSSPQPAPPSPAVRAAIAQAHALLASGNPAGALEHLERTLKAHPADHALVVEAAQAAFAGGDTPRTITLCERALALRPDDAGMRINTARLLLRTARLEDALRHLSYIVKIRPAFAQAYLDAAQALMDMGRPAAAVTWARRGEQAPVAQAERDALGAVVAQGQIMLGAIKEGIARIDAMPPAHRGAAGVLALRAFAFNYRDDRTPEEIFAAHREVGALLDTGPDLSQSWKSRDRAPERRLRLGIISNELRTHSVAFFLEPLLREISREQFEVYLYHTNRIEDATTTRLRAFAHAYRSEGLESPQGLARALAQDQIDIAIETSGLSSILSPAVLASRVVPVSVTFLGYPNTTGSMRITARLVDSTTDPAPAADALATERLVRLDPCFLCYQPSPHAPEVSAPDGDPQAGATRPIAFASFNAVAKITPATARLWARILERVPGSVLRIKAATFAEFSVQEQTRERLASLGLPMQRVEFLPAPASTRDHLAQYALADVALDPFPYHGTTTTCEALWMGVPVVTLAGRSHVSRVGASILHAVGLPELCAQDEDAYVRIASDLALDAPRRAALRAGLRERVRTSPLTDAPAYARRVEAALRTLWREHVAKA